MTRKLGRRDFACAAALAPLAAIPILRSASPAVAATGSARPNGVGGVQIDPDAVATIPGPDLTTKPPKRRAPPGACDSHLHIFGKPSEVPLSPKRRYTPAEATLEQATAMHAVLGIERMVIVQPSPYGLDNDFEREQLETFGARGRGSAVIDAATPDSDIEVLHKAGFRAARFNLVSGGGVATSELETVAARIAKLGWHLELFVDAAQLVELTPQIAKLPTEIVIDHMGMPNAQLGTEQPGFQALLGLRAEGRTWVKLSAPYRIDAGPAPWPKADPFARALIETAPERCLWGSDWPHTRPPGPMPNDGDLFDRLLAWTENDDQLLKTILVDNPARLYGF